MAPRRDRLAPWTLRTTDQPDYESLALDALLAQGPESQSPELGMRPTPHTADALGSTASPQGGVQGGGLDELAADSLSLLALWRQFLVTSLSESSVQDYWGAVRRFTFAVPVPILEVTEDHITGFLASFPERSQARVAYFQALRHLFGWLKRRGYRVDNPTEDLSVQAPMERVPAALTEEQLTRLVHAAATRAPFRGYVLCLLYYTAARVSEAVALRWSDVREGQLLIQGFKGGRERWVPIKPGLGRTIEGLAEVGSDPEYLIGRTTMTVWKWVRDAGEMTGISNVHPHLFRATAATIMMRRGARPDVVRLYLGHAKLQTTLRYLAVEQTELDEAGGLL